MMVIVGLGNPGRGYDRTRHNVGARAVEELAARWGITLARRRHALMGHGHVEGHGVALARPRSYMNVSGESVAYLVRRFRIPMDRLLVVYDDMDLPLGGLRLRPQGGPGGHNGVSSIIAALGTEDFPRLRIGIGRPPPFVDPVAHVLGALTRTEEDALAGVWARVTAAAESVVVDGLERAMNRHNTAPVPENGGPEGDRAAPPPPGSPPTY